MADEMVIDGDETRDQIYTAVDMGDDGFGDEIYIVSIGAPLVLFFTGLGHPVFMLILFSFRLFC